MIRTNREISSHQIGDLLGAITHLRNHLRYMDADSTATKHGEADTSIEASLIRACNRLDEILDDPARWALPKDGHDQIADIAKSQAEIVALQAELIKLQVFAGKFRQQLVVNDLLGSPSVPEEDRSMGATLDDLEHPADRKQPTKKAKKK